MPVQTDFSKELNNEVISRSNETYTPEELEVLVEGSINYLHTKPAIVDNSPEFYIDSTVTTLVEVMVKIPLHRYTKT
ncbi:MAG: hypothetical protein IPL23_16510 [Saprospiraceae bacterium]|nr:hypothetical protein [Saprospiraceae bacterium]